MACLVDLGTSQRSSLPQSSHIQAEAVPRDPLLVSVGKAKPAGRQVHSESHVKLAALNVRFSPTKEAHGAPAQPTKTLSSLHLSFPPFKRIYLVLFFSRGQTEDPTCKEATVGSIIHRNTLKVDFHDEEKRKEAYSKVPQF
jgi:hypothetical protein